MSIDRYEFVVKFHGDTEDTDMEMNGEIKPDGKWVKFEDHQKEIEGLKDRIKELEDD